METGVIQFALNGQLQKLDQADPNLSILTWLRTKMRLTATKEGCGSGDCGACTVIMGTPDPSGDMRYEAVNSCIALIGSLHGRHLITLEAFQQTPCHPVQQAMIEQHASQCGFCTPGIVMSLIALHAHQAGQPAPRPAVLEALSGNLCRCTGYRPIVAAGQQAMVQQWQPDTPGHPARGLADPARDPILTVDSSGDACLAPPSGARFDAPASLAALIELRRRHPRAQLVAGSTDLALNITQGLARFEHLISVSRVPELRGCQVEDGALVIGAATTFTELRAPLSQYWPAFDGLLERLGSLQIRNRGTLGGNIGNASPIGDMPPALIALGATLVLNGPDGERRLPLESFFLGYKNTDLRPGEFIHSVRLPLPAADTRLFIYKVSKRLDDDISAVLGAFHLTVSDGRVSDCRLAYGGMAATPARARQAESALRGQAWTETTVAAAVAALDQDFSPLSDVRASAEYRRRVAGNLLRRALAASRPDERNQPLTVTDYA
jgi:xanthine dehydrogenase small subunit|tara:strand:- start:638 stop:2119 length:1482 start_codon:yes stop_codon:yes gene_type:complete